jgi:hypothetical protein
LRRTTVTLLALVLAGTVVATGCATERTDDLGISFEGDEGFDAADDDLDSDLDEPIAPDTGLDDGEAPSSDQVVRAALTDVDSFWSRTYEDLYGEPYQPIEGGFWPYGPSSEQPPCGSPPPG